MKEENPWKISPAPLHTHYNEENQRDELCGFVFCPEGFVGVEYKKENPAATAWSSMSSKPSSKTFPQQRSDYY